MNKTISILGSTGSIGTQSLTVCRKLGLSVFALSAHSNAQLLEEQVRQFHPRFAVLTDPQAASRLKAAVADTDTTVLSGMEGVLEVAQNPEQDTVINALMGVAGLRPTVAAIKAGNNQERTDTLTEQVAILEGLLPKQISGDELIALIDATLAETGATAKKEMGRVMGALTQKTGGNFDKAAAAKELQGRLQ